MTQPVTMLQAQQYEVVMRPVLAESAQKIMKIVKITDLASSSRNVLWLSSHDMVKLFPESEKGNIACHVMIADKVYRVAASQLLKKGMVGVNLLQHREINESISLIDNNESVVLTPYKMANQAVPAFYVIFEIALHNSNLNDKTPVLNLNQLRSSMKVLFKDRMIQKGQSYLLQLGNKQYEISVNTALNMESKHSGFYKIDEETKIDFVPETDGEISIVEEVVDRPIHTFKFDLTVYGEEDEENPFSPIVSIDSLKEQLMEEMIGQRLMKDKEWDVTLDNGSILTAAFKEAVELSLKRMRRSDEVNATELYEKQYVYDIKAEIEFDWDPDVLTLTKGKEMEPKAIHFEILRYAKNKRDKELESFRKDWVSAEEFKQKILEMEKPFVQNQLFHLELSSGVYLVKVTKIVAPSSPLDDRRDRIKREWKVTEKVPVHIKEGFKLQPTLVNSSKAYPITRLELKVSPVKKEAKLNILCKEEVLKAMKEELKKKLVLDQLFYVTVGKEIFHVFVEAFDVDSPEESSKEYDVLGKVTDDTIIDFVNDSKDPVTILPEAKSIDIKDPIGKLEELGVGGLSEQMKDIVREIFLGRGEMKEEMKRRGRKPEKGILFYGPPGTGKTALARNLAVMLKGENVIMKTAPELFSKWVGESEKNVRKLFEPAEAAYKKLGEKSPLFVIIIDEIDGLLGVRGDDGNSVRNSVVNQFLGKIDGPHQLENILVIGMTNRKDQMDPAAIRSGRLGLHIEIPAPEQAGREKIFEIHTRTLKEEKLLAEDVDLVKLAHMMDNCVGADIEAVVRRVISYSVERLNALDLTPEERKVHPDGISTMADFIRAVEDVKKQKGEEKEQLSEAVQRMFM